MKRRRKLTKLPPLLQVETNNAKRVSHHQLPKQQEKDVAKAVGGRRRPASGALPFLKGDVDRDDSGFPLLIECKRSSGKSIRLEASFLAKITTEALMEGKYPALAIQFDGSVMQDMSQAGRQMSASTDWIAIPLSTFSAILEALGEEGLAL